MSREPRPARDCATVWFAVFDQAVIDADEERATEALSNLLRLGFKVERVDGQRSNSIPFDELPFTNLRRASLLLGVPQAWLKRLARDGVIPTLRSGNRIHYPVREIEKVLLKLSGRVESHYRSTSAAK